MTELPMRPTDGTLSIAVVVGHPQPGSRTQVVATRVGRLLGDIAAAGGHGPVGVTTIALADVAAHLVRPQSAAGAATVREALATAHAARLLVVASPTYKGTYSGVLKTFLDLLPRTGLAGAVALPVMVAASPAYSHAVDTYLRPLLIELGALVPVPGVCVLESELPFLDDVLAGWVRRGGSALLGVLDRLPAERI